MNYLLLATLFLAQITEPVGVPSWVPIVIGVILLLLFWWGLSRNSIAQGAATHNESHEGDHADQGAHDDHHEVAAPAEAAVAEPALARTAAVPLAEATPQEETAVTPNDLKIIEGIGPKIESILHEAGIRTYTELAAASVSQLEKIVREDAGIRIAFPDTWPEQSRLAAEGKWAELEKLQDELKGGREA